MGAFDDLIPITPDDRVRFNEAADVLDVVRNRDRFVETIGAHVYTTNLRNGLIEKDDRLIAAAKAVRSAHAAVAKLSPRQRGLLGVIITSPSLGAPWLDHTIDLDTQDNLAAILIGAMDAAFGEMIGRGPHAATGRKGKPKGAKTRWGMHLFVLELWDMCRPYGSVTLSNDGGQAGGSIVRLLNALRPMLPKRFFPGILSYSFLRTVQKSLPPDPLRDVSVYSD